MFMLTNPTEMAAAELDERCHANQYLAELRHMGLPVTGSGDDQDIDASKMSLDQLEMAIGHTVNRFTMGFGGSDLVRARKQTAYDLYREWVESHLSTNANASRDEYFRMRKGAERIREKYFP
jgi:hypothetical protein